LEKPLNKVVEERELDNIQHFFNPLDDTDFLAEFESDTPVKKV
jgi:hypothetical protein